MNHNELSHLRPKLESALELLTLELSPQQVDLLMEYLLLLQKWNKVYNLTAIRDPEEMLTKHLIDSLAVVPHIDSESIIDVGTGGGLPGIPLAICFPERRIDLLDSNSKKTRFLIQAKAQLGLNNTQVWHKRVEEYQPEPLYDAVISRAFASLEDMLTWTHHLIPEGGVWWAMKAQKETEDLAGLPEYAEVTRIIELQVPGLDAQRRLIQAQKKAD
ncbi:16S rRNA (guanine(527)-N(7))-methyltransferase RsmG [Thiomicrorhabdus sp. 6S3-12]|uniref:16S rRNA (guanine(527)-N(7))-methyltransferase RsmG n=1 Tax=Thiomicrorhabdus sp. 6S3-12 TaxID=2819681 RepID=UPI001AAD0877|nr:16S rRNA (guanine(527)-N(7))-methyltransferase RsmG [Thiomicrorhabdus sp. 6S3-12]MBO1923457.1 16S rRNA (guanine(527)-N(7))-methyltransferase RsmG [Thiomicrorhabdus sp. 6S3-12]